MFELTYLATCAAITLALVLGVTVFHMGRFGPSAFESAAVLVDANRVREVAAPITIAGYTSLLIVFDGLRGMDLVAVGLVGAAFLFLMWSRVGILLVLYTVCLVGGLAHWRGFWRVKEPPKTTSEMP